eukprot:c21831_g1_i2 orf=285-3629(-)
MPYADQQRQVGHSNSSSLGRSSLPAAPVGGYKRTASDYAPGVPDVHKRPRLSEPSMVLDVQAYRMQHEITVMGESIPPPFMTFDVGNFPPEITKELHSAGFAAPTPIQAQSWPIALQKRDIVAIAKTGSGKTLGYLLPAFLQLLRIRANSRAGPIILVLAPTRELATQIQDEAVKFGRSSRITSTCVYGGAPKGPQLRDLERGADIVIATPGRLNDFLEVKKISLRQVSYLVLDEADRMLDMGFEPQIRKIVKEIPPSRQTLMFTATWPKEVRKIAADLLVNAVHVNIGNSDELTANKAITQHVEVVQPLHKQRRLEEILRSQEPGAKVIIFCSTKKMCDQLARNLSRGFRAVAIHGDKSQSERDHVLAQFKAGRYPILVATDVAARGLDVKDIRVVINYDFPTGVEDYVHRIGRTGRAGATGEAFTFFSEQDSKFARELVKILEGADQKVPFELRQFAGRSGQSRGRARWQTGGMSPAEGSFNDRGAGHRTIGISGRDGNVRGGGHAHRDGGLSTEAAGRWGFADGGIPSRDGGRDHSIGGRVGSIGDRVGGMISKDVRIGSRIEGRAGSMGSRGEVVSTRREDVNGAIGTRSGGVVGTRDGGSRSAEGGHKDGWGDSAHDDGWGGASGSVGWGQSDRAGHGDIRPGDRGGKDVWGDAGRSDGLGGVSGGRGSFGLTGKPPEPRGRIFDRLGERGRSSEKNARKDLPSDGRVPGGDDTKKSISAKEEMRRSGGSYSRSPSKGWRGSGSLSPRKGLTRSRSRTPSKSWGRSRSRSRSPGRGWGGNHRRSDDQHGRSGSFYQSHDGLRNRSTISPRSLHSPRGRERSARQLGHQAPYSAEDGKGSREYTEELKTSKEFRQERSSVGTEGGNVREENEQANQPVLLASEDPALDRHGATERSVDSKPVISASVSETVLQDNESKDIFLPDEGCDLSARSKLHMATPDPLLTDLPRPDESTEMKAHSISTLDSDANTHQLSDQTSAGIPHEQLSSYQASKMSQSSKIDFSADDNGALFTVRKTNYEVNLGTHSEQMAASSLDSRYAAPIEEEHRFTASNEGSKLVDSKPRTATHGMLTSEDGHCDIDASGGLTVQASEFSESHIADAVSSPEEGMVM